MDNSCGLWPVLMSITVKAFGSVESMQHGDMADVSSTEKLCLSNYARKHVRYGSTARGSSMIREKYLKHNVQPNDTLQGLALRYGVTMEQIKRANKMWTTDSLFLYSTLDIPVYEEPLTVSSMSSSPPGSPDKGNDNMSHVSLHSSNHVVQTLSPTVHDSMNSTLSAEEESAADFLIRIDSHIAQQKDKVLKLQKRNV